MEPLDGKETMCSQIVKQLNTIYGYGQHNCYHVPHLRTSIFKNMEKFDANECANIPTFVKKIEQEHITGKYTKSIYGAFYHMRINDGVLNLKYEFL